MSVATDSSLRRWDLKTGKSKDTPLRHPDGVNAAAISHDGRIIATGDQKGVVRVWSEAGRLLAKFDEHTDRITSLAFNRDGTLLASGSSDELIKLWKVPQPDRK